jgi:hypothetical protein
VVAARAGGATGAYDHGLPDLRRLAASLHAQMGRHGEAVELAWQEHPQDAIPVFCRQVKTAVDVTKRGGYELAVSLLTEVSECYE